MGLAGGYGLPAKDILWALEQGLDYIWWAPEWTHMLSPLKEFLPGHREKVVLACGTDKFDGPGTVASLEERLRILGTDYLDVFMLHFVDSEEQWRQATEGALPAIQKARSQGKVRHVSFSSHNRPLVARMAASGAFELITVRYNAAHVGAEMEVFPAARRQGCGVVIYVALRWGELLTPPKGWKGAAPAAHELYRFVLEHPAVDVVMTSPRTSAQLKENLKAVQNGFRLPSERLEELRAYGRLFREQMA